MSQLLNVSICITDLLEQANKKHSAFTRGKNGKIYVNIRQWINDEDDQYGNISSLLLSSSKEKKDQEGKIYVGNAKLSKVQEQATAPITAEELAIEDSLPF